MVLLLALETPLAWLRSGLPCAALVKGKGAFGLKDYTESGCDWQGTEV